MKKISIYYDLAEPHDISHEDLYALQEKITPLIKDLLPNVKHVMVAWNPAQY